MLHTVSAVAALRRGSTFFTEKSVHRLIESPEGLGDSRLPHNLMALKTINPCKKFCTERFKEHFCLNDMSHSMSAEHPAYFKEQWTVRKGSLYRKLVWKTWKALNVWDNNNNYKQSGFDTFSEFHFAPIHLNATPLSSSPSLMSGFSLLLW